MQSVYRGQHIAPDGSDITATDADWRAAARECTTFLDCCAAEAARERWFPVGCNRENTQRIRMLTAVRELGGATTTEAAIRAGLCSDMAGKAVRQLMQAGQVHIVGLRNGRRVYKATEEAE